MDINALIKDELLSLGFSAAGIGLPAPPPHLDTYRSWLEQGRHAEMSYLASERALTLRAQPERILPGSGAVIVTALSYPGQSVFPSQAGSDRPLGRTASYAWGVDYHHIIPQRMNQAVKRLEAVLGKPVSSRSYTDTGPILEREFSQRAGLGWIGKNTCLIIPGRGSYFLLGEIFIDAPLAPDEPFLLDRCGSCRRCIEACPTGCIQDDRTLDARECISYLTIENKGSIPERLRPALGSWVFGCDICQQVCPWNLRFASGTGDAELAPNPDRATPDLLQELILTPQAFTQKFRLSPQKRAKRRGYLRNVAVALGNSGDRSAVRALSQTLLNEEEALIRGHAAWALGRLGGTAAHQALEKALRTETDPQVRGEIQKALRNPTPE